MSKITGRIEVLVNGQPLLNKSGAKASGIGRSGEPAMEVEAIVGDGGVHGYIEKPVIPMCEVTITDRDDVSLDAFARIREDGTVIFRTHGGGKVYTLRDATCSGNFNVTGGEGETPVVFMGSSWVESVESS